jgi:hypothetical protein
MEAAVRVLRYTSRPRDLGVRWLESPFLIFFLLASAVIGAMFWRQAIQQEGAFNVDTFGRFALMFPAEWWAGAMMAGSLLTFWGLTHPPKRWLMIAGSVVNALQFTGLGYSAILTGGEVVVGLYASIMFAPASLITLWAAVQHDAD